LYLYWGTQKYNFVLKTLKIIGMKSSLLITAVALLGLGSCSVYKSGQTPDDVYFSPAKEKDSYVAANMRSDRYSGYEYDNPDDRWLRMRVRDPYRWSTFDDYGYGYANYGYNSWAYNPYSLSYSYFSPFGWNSYWMWNNYYNPYYSQIVVLNPKTQPAVYNRVRNLSLSSYTNRNYNNRNNPNVRPRMRLGSSNAGYNNSNSGLGSSIRKVFSGANNSGSGVRAYSPSSSERPVRSFTPSVSPSRSTGSSSSSGGGGGGVSRPSRSGRN
jgi:hypothetical protein